MTEEKPQPSTTIYMVWCALPNDTWTLEIETPCWEEAFVVWSAKQETTSRCVLSQRICCTERETFDAWADDFLSRLRPLLKDLDRQGRLLRKFLFMIDEHVTFLSALYGMPLRKRRIFGGYGVDHSNIFGLDGKPILPFSEWIVAVRDKKIGKQKFAQVAGFGDRAYATLVASIKNHLSTSRHDHPSEEC